MKFGIYFSAILLISLLSACTMTGPETVEKEKKMDVKPAEQESKSAVFEAELQYVKALRETDRAKRNKLFKAARILVGLAL